MKERTLFLLRHAKAVPAEAGGDDRERVLSPRGRRQAKALAAWFRDSGLNPERVLASPSARTRETVELVRTGFAHRAESEFDPVLYLAAWPAILERIRRVPEACGSLLVVGHNPGLHELALSLAVMAPSRKRHALAAKFPTGALARFRLDRPWREFNRASINLVEALSPSDLDPGEADED